MATKNVLVTDAGQRVSLEIVRCLGQGDLSVTVVEKKSVSNPLSFASHYSDECVRIDDYTDPDFQSLVKQSDAVIPVSTNTHYDIYKQDLHRSSELLLPDGDVFQAVNNKEEIIAITNELSIPTPKTTSLSPDSDKWDLSQFNDFPMVVKLSTDRDLYLSPRERYSKVNSQDELNQALDNLKQHGKQLLVQQYIPGEGFGFSGLFESGHCVKGIAHHRKRELPPSGGPSTDCETTRDSALQNYAKSLLEHVAWDGPAMVEFRRHRDTGEFYFMEVNPRYWGSLPLARASGINIPLAHYRLIRDNGPENIENEKIDHTRVKFLFMDLISFWQSLLSGDESIKDAMRWHWELLSGKYTFGLIDGSDLRPVGRYLYNKMSGILGDSSRDT